MKLAERSPKAREKFADSNMAVANAIASAVFIGVLVFPLSAFISALALGNEPFSTMKIPNWWQVALFAVLYLSPLGVAWHAKEIALDIYDQIDQSAARSDKKTRSPARPTTKRMRP